MLFRCYSDKAYLTTVWSFGKIADMGKGHKEQGQTGLSKFHVLASIEFDIGASNEKEARRFAEEALFYGANCYSFGDITIASAQAKWGSDNPFTEVGPIKRDGSFEDFYEEEEGDEEEE